MRPQTEMTASTTLAVAIGKKRSACAQSSVPSFRPIALKKSRFQKFNRYCTNNCRRTTETINAIRSHARHADRPRQNPDALCQNRVRRRLSSGARYASGDISFSGNFCSKYRSREPMLLPTETSEILSAKSPADFGRAALPTLLRLRHASNIHFIYLSLQSACRASQK